MEDLIAFPAIIFLFILVFFPPVISSIGPPAHIEKPAVYTSNIISPSPTLSIIATPVSSPKPQAQVATPTPDTRPWGIAKQITEHTWVIRVNNDPIMDSSPEILSALNNLRARHGAQPLFTDSRLCDYAQKRADFFKKIQNTDEHKGIAEFLANESNYDKLGFNWIGENSSYGYIMSGVHLIEFVYNSDPDHSKNQLDPKWDHACVGVNSPATDIIFATSPR